MASRALGRSLVLQSLYEWDFYDRHEELKAVLRSRIKILILLLLFRRRVVAAVPAGAVREHRKLALRALRQIGRLERQMAAPSPYFGNAVMT